MGRPLSRQQFFGANANNNIKVHFYNGTAGVQGYILRQRSTKHFLCEDTDGNQRVCKLVDKVRADLLAGEMSIAFKFDDATIGHAVKISRHLITVMYDGMYRNMPWNFSTSTSDGAWQIDEAGTDAAMDGSTDVGAEDFNTLTSYPVPGSGDFVTPGLPSYSAVGSPAEPSGSITTVVGYAAGLLRNKYLGNFCSTASSTPATWNFGFFGTAQVVNGSQIADTFAGFGSQTDLESVDGGHNFSLQSKGWIKAPITQTYNFYGTSDDHMALWIGNAAKTGFDNTNCVLAGHGGLISPIASVTMDAGKWYPIRLWFSEFHGNCHEQFFAVGSLSGQQFASTDFTFKYNPAGEAGWAV